MKAGEKEKWKLISSKWWQRPAVNPTGECQLFDENYFRYNSSLNSFNYNPTLIRIIVTRCNSNWWISAAIPFWWKEFQLDNNHQRYQLSIFTVDFFFYFNYLKRVSWYSWTVCLTDLVHIELLSFVEGKPSLKCSLTVLRFEVHL